MVRDETELNGNAGSIATEYANVRSLGNEHTIVVMDRERNIALALVWTVKTVPVDSLDKCLRYTSVM